MLISGYITSFRALVFPLIFMVIMPRATMSQSEFEHRYKQRSPSNYNLCFTNTSMCTNPFVSEMNHCLEHLEETQDEEGFTKCVCAIRNNSRSAWNTCSECLRSNYNDQTLGTWSRECPPSKSPGTLSGGKLCRC